MLAFFKRVLSFFGFSEPTPAPQPEPKPLTIDFEWPFPSPKPPNVDYLLKELIAGTKTEGDHTFFYWNGKKRRHIRTVKGTETVLARHMVWWMFGRNHPKFANGLTTNCGEAKCIKLDHLILKIPQTQYGPQKRPIPPANKVPKEKQPPKPPEIRNGKHTTLDRYIKEDRNRCISRKAYFETELRARQEKNAINKRSRGPKLYVYPCTLMDCKGWHLTHIDPKKYNKTKKRKGAW